jgi:acyl-CoA synthetase (AMP-forming)/AMP-acid ligase II
MSFVYGSPHEIHGEEVIAGVVVEPGRVVDAEELIGYCRTRLSSYKVPRVVVLLGIDEIPYLASSKPDRIAIRAMLETRCAAMPKAKSNLNP